MKPKGRESFSPEFKMEAVRLVQAGKKPVTQIARELDVPRQYLHTWVREAAKRKGESPSEIFPGNGKLREADAELARLRKENAQLREDNEILKKATAFFAKESR
jgi:transposase-like protein